MDSRLEPQEPIELRMCMSEGWKQKKLLDRISTHIEQCQRILDPDFNCGDRVCGYFSWFPRHYNQCSQFGRQGSHCPHCMKLVQWVSAHASQCQNSQCQLPLCQQIKKRMVKDHIANLTGATNLFPSQPDQDPEESLKLLRRYSDPNSSRNSDPHNDVECDSQLPSRMYSEGSLDYDPSRRILTKQSSSDTMLPSTDDPYHQFNRTTSVSSRTSSIASSVGNWPYLRRMDSSDNPLVNSATSSFGVRVGSLGTVFEPHLETHPCLTQTCSAIVDDGNSHQATTSLNSHGDYSKMVTPRGSIDKRHVEQLLDGRSPSLSPKHTSHPSTSETSSSGIESGNNSQVDSESEPDRDSDTMDTMGTVKNEMEDKEQEDESEPSNEDTSNTITMVDENSSHSFTSGSTIIGEPLSKSRRPTPPQISPEEIQTAMERIDAVQRANRDEITKVANLGKIIPQEPSTDPHKTDEELEAPFPFLPRGCKPDFDIDYVDQQQLGESPQFAKQEHQIYQEMLAQPFAEKEKDIREELEHRESVREFLRGQFYRQKVYREGVHWERQWQIGSGGQAKCYCILDKQNSSQLALKEERDNDKAVDEAYICLRLACLLKYDPPNIVEFFGAAMVPDRRLIQLFLELMPCCLQGHMFKNGPLCQENVTNFAYQLFEALDFLHNKLKVVHCDIKPANVLVDHNLQRLKLADFGSAELLEEYHLGGCFYGNDRAGTLSYNPPEHYRERRCSFAFDIWQAGCTIMAMSTGKRPWRHLFMDCVDKTNPRFPRMKEHYKQLIGQQQNGHMTPSFLEPTLHQLLYGCLHPQYERRLSARDCCYLLANADAVSDKQREKIQEAFGHSYSLDVLENLQPNPNRLDVYLGSELDVNCAGLHHKLQGGWLGCVECYDGMTYHEVCRNIAPPHFQVAAFFQGFRVAVCENSPQGIWRTIHGHPGGVRFCSIDENTPVDRTKAVVVFPPCARQR